MLPVAPVDVLAVAPQAVGQLAPQFTGLLAAVARPDLSVLFADLSVLFADLSTSLADLSTSLADLSTTLADLSTSLADLSTSLADLSVLFVGLYASLVDLSTSLADLSTTLADLSTTLADLSVLFADLSTSLVTPLAGPLETLEALVKEATGWPGLAIIWVYSFLIAFVLPGPSEVVLLAPLDLGLPYPVTLGLIMVVSGFGKAAGSLLAFHIGQEAKEAGPIVRWLRRSRFDVMEWSERTAVRLAQRWGYVGLALALSVPLFPDTVSIYAFAVLEEDYPRFAAATFAGSIGRLLVTVFVVGGVAVTV